MVVTSWAFSSGDGWDHFRTLTREQSIYTRQRRSASGAAGDLAAGHLGIEPAPIGHHTAGDIAGMDTEMLGGAIGGDAGEHHGDGSLGLGFGVDGTHDHFLFGPRVLSQLLD